jgi:hypothetical protein
MQLNPTPRHPVLPLFHHWLAARHLASGNVEPLDLPRGRDDRRACGDQDDDPADGARYLAAIRSAADTTWPHITHREVPR